MASSLAEQLLESAVSEGQSVHRITPEDDVQALRREVRSLARAQRVKLRTGIVEDRVLAVVLLDSAIWDEPESVMRSKLAAPSPPGDQ